MKIEKYKKLKDNRYQLFLDNQNEIILYDDIILKYNLLLKKNIDEKELKEILKENNSLECYYKSIKYLAKKSRCKKEVIAYLTRNHYEEKEIEKAIQLLEEKKYLNEDNYLKSYINDQILFTHNGPTKIKRKLLDLDLQEEKINEALSVIDEKIWNEKLQKIITKKIAVNRKESAPKLKEKIILYCMNEGYSKENILKIINTVDITTNSAILEKEFNKVYIKLSRKYKNESDLFFELKRKLYTRGFTKDEIENVIQTWKENKND